MQIFHAFGAIIGGLSGRVTNAFQNRSRWNRRRIRDEFCQERSLVEPALAFARGMERDRYDEIEVAAAEPRVAQTFRKPACDGITEVALPAVFELMENFANKPAAAIDRDRAIEMKRAMFAVRATERLCDSTVKRLGTLRAERQHYARRTMAAIGAQIFATADIRGTDSARRRIKEGCGGREDLRKNARQHNVTRL